MAIGIQQLNDDRQDSNNSYNNCVGNLDQHCSDIPAILSVLPNNHCNDNHGIQMQRDPLFEFVDDILGNSDKDTLLENDDSSDFDGNHNNNVNGSGNVNHAINDKNNINTSASLLSITSTVNDADNDISYDESLHSKSTATATSISNLKQHYEAILSKLQSTHNQQIDEILLQLSSIESTYHDEINTLQQTMTKKEVMCDALTASLSDYKKRNVDLEQEIEHCTITCNELEFDLNKISLELKEARKENLSLRQHYDELRKSSEQEKQDAVTLAQQEIQSQAETQFAIAQKKFIQLKTDHQQNMKEKEILQEQVTSLTQQNNNKERVHKQVIAQMQEELLVSRKESDKVKSMLHERMSQLERNQNDLEQKLEHKIKECQVLSRENKELQSVCEELMHIVEGGGVSAK